MALLLTLLPITVLAVFFCGFTSAADPLPEECQKICPLNYAPVCVEDNGELLNFGNLCALSVYNCEHKKDLVVKFQEQCPDL